MSDVLLRLVERSLLTSMINVKKISKKSLKVDYMEVFKSNMGTEILS